jgi:hypothetical protein
MKEEFLISSLDSVEDPPLSANNYQRSTRRNSRASSRSAFNKRIQVSNRRRIDSRRKTILGTDQTHGFHFSLET